MKITIDNDIVRKYGLDMGSFLTLLIDYYDVDIGSMQLTLNSKGLASPDLFKEVVGNYPTFLWSK